MRVPFPTGLHRSAYDDEQEWVNSARFAADLLARTVGSDRLEGIDLLDVGCGIKLTKILIDQEWPIASYAGVDVSDEVIRWLRGRVSDPRFSFHHLAARNELYNPQGAPLAEVEALPIGDRTFDLISLFSVFTHLDPLDYVAMLKLLRPHIRPDGVLLFSLFVKDPNNRIAAMLREALGSDDPVVAQHAHDSIARKMVDDDALFVDEVPDTPLLRARYDNAYALSLVEGTGWSVSSLEPPDQYIQNYMICRPA